MLIASIAPAQQKQLSMQDAMINARTTLAPQTLRMLQFVKGCSDYVYLKKIDGKDVWVRGNFSSKEDTPFLTLAQLNERMRLASLDTFVAMPPLNFNNDNIELSIKGSKYSIGKDNKYTLLNDKKYAAKENADQSADGYVAYLDNHDLYIAKGNDAKRITTDGSEDIVYASSVHQNEWGINKGTYWSNSGKTLAFYRMDQSMIKPYPIIDWSEIPAKANNVKYPMAGDSNHAVTVGVYNTQNQSTIWLQTPKPTVEYFLTNIAWSPDDRYIFIAVVNRQQNHTWLNQYDAATGALVKTLFEETDEHYSEPLNPVLFVKNKPNQFIWTSNRDGYTHLYLYDISGKLLTQLTKGTWEVTEVKGFDDKGENLWFVSTQQSAITKDLYQLNLKTLKVKRITQGTGVHNTIVSSDNKSVIDVFSNRNNPRTAQLIDVKSGKAKLLMQAEDPLKDYAKGALSIFTIKNSSGDSLYCRQYLPVGFDAGKKYPVIVYWYGGPHAQLILDAWNGGAGDYWFQYMAERGFVVFTVDTRGSDNRGKAFEQVIHRRTGEPQMEDMMDAIAYLKSQSFVDGNKMGLFGWSYGGFMTTNFLLHHPGIFKAGVAGGPVMNWRMYEVMYGERYMDMPQENKEGYDATNLTKQAAKLKDKLLLIHGLQDPVVVQQHSINFVKAAVDAGVQVDYMIYPGHEHNVLGKDRAHLYQKVTDYFMLYLK